MRPTRWSAALLFCGNLLLRGQMIDKCSPGWSMVNQLREQLNPDISKETLGLLKVSIETRLANCRGIPDLWYYRALVDDQLKDTRDATYARRQADSLGSELLAAKVNPFDRAQFNASKLSKTVGEKYALVVGINEFQNIRAPLQSAVNDARSVAELLTDPQVGRFRKSNVFSLVNQGATLEAVRTAIGEIRARAREEDLVLIYIASHGSPRKDDPNGVSYILMHDTRSDTAANLYATSLQMAYLVDILRKDLRARRAALILDTCFSGDATGAAAKPLVYSAKKELGPPTEFSVAADQFDEKDPSGAARIVISASRADEKSWEDESSGHGYFTRYLLDALRENGGATPLRDVFHSVHDRTLQIVSKLYGSLGVRQTPTMRSTSAGLDLVLGVATATP